MKKYLNISLILVLILWIAAIIILTIKMDNKYAVSNNDINKKEIETIINTDINIEEPKKEEVKNVEEDENIDTIKSEKINILLLGVEEDPRTDTIIFVSLDMKNKTVNMISIPRDTYYYIEGYESGDHRKINAAYARNREVGSIKAVENILNISIDYYITVKYTAIQKIVDLIGGVEVDVPSWFDNIPTGLQTLNGKQAVNFLRGRKGYPSGDIGRIKAQQEFILNAIKKALSSNIILVAKEAFNEVKTDMDLKDVLYYTYKLLGMDIEDISMYTLPGKSSLDKIVDFKYWYYHYDEEKTKEMMLNFTNIAE